MHKSSVERPEGSEDKSVVSRIWLTHFLTVYKIGGLGKSFILIYNKFCHVNTMTQ